MSVCPKCLRAFHEASGFCPFDGTLMIEDTLGTPVPAGPEEVAPPRPPASARAADYDQLIGQTLDSRYRIETRVGEGGMGVVFRARHIVIEKPVAVKVLKREVARDQNVVRRFVQEARAASRIGHPNIIDVTDFGVTPDGMTYQVMEFLEGQTLAGVLRAERRLPVSRVLPIVAQLVRALGAAHDKGIVHRDLKPENVFLLARDGRQDFVKVVDFGIAKVQPVEGSPEEPRLTRAGSVFGTPEYMAPEQVQGRADADHRVDVYALGTIFYEMLAGHPPHRGETPMRTLAMQLLDPIRPLRQVVPDLVLSDALDAVVMRALAKKRENRYESMQAMLDALAAAAVDVPLDQPLSASASAPLGPEPDTLRERRESGGASDDIDTLPARAPTPARAHELSESRATGGQGDGEDEDGIQVVPHERTGRSPGGVGRARRGSEGDSAMLRPSGGALPARAAARESSSPAAFAEVAPSSRPTERPHARHRWATMAALLALTGGIGATVALLAAQGGGHAAGKEPIAVIAADAGPSGGAATADLTRAAADREPPRDAGAAPPSSARESGKAHTANGRKAGVLPRRDAHPHATDAGGSEVLGRGPDVEMKVITDPAGGRLIHDDIDGGPDGTNFRRPEGTRLDVECRKYENLVLTARGKVRLDFDGQSHLAICHMAPLPRKKCLPGLKNPLDDCP